MRQEQRCGGKRSSFAPVSEIVELSYTVRLSPDADFASVLKHVVIPLDGFLSIERDCEMIAAEVHTQSVPRSGRHFYIGSFLLCPFAFDRVVNRHVILEGVGARDVVVVRILQSPDNTASLIF